MTSQIQRMTSAEAQNLASKTGTNCLLFVNTLNEHLGLITPAGLVFHFDGTTSAFVAGE